MTRLQAASLVVALSLALPALADTLNVPQDHPTIQAAIDAAVDGDVVVVSPGTYPEGIRFNGKSITVRSVDPSDLSVVSATMIDATGIDVPIVVRFVDFEDEDAVLDGLTVMGGHWVNQPGDPNHGGILVNQSAPTVRRCIVRNNMHGGVSSSTAGFGGVQTIYASPTFDSCTFVDNRGWVAGGAANVNHGSATFTGCVFVGNFAQEVGGAVLVNVADATIVGCSFVSNGFMAVCATGNSLVFGDNVMCGAVDPDQQLYVGPECEFVDLGGNVLMDDCPNPADLNLDGSVDGADLGLLLALWGPQYVGLAGDFNADGKVDGGDLGLMLAAWTG